MDRACAPLNNGWRVTRPVTVRQFDAYFDLRWRILRAPWNQPRGSEKDEFESTADHAAAVDENERIIGVGRLHTISDEIAQIRFMAVEADCRGEGVGRGILVFLEGLARDRAIERIVINARVAAVPFYADMGYSLTERGPRLFGAIEHSGMEKFLGREG